MLYYTVLVSMRLLPDTYGRQAFLGKVCMNDRETRMATAPMPSLMIKMSLPMMMSMLVLALYNIVDSVFVSMLADGENALAALALAFPFQMLVTGVSVGTAVGTCSLVSRRLGQGNRLQADSTATNGMMLSILSGIVALVCGLTLSNGCINLVNGGDAISPGTMGYATNYLTICMSCSMFLMVQVMSEKLLQSCGHMVLSMLVQLIGGVVNIVLDPIMIFGLLGFPAMGVAGAAWATVSGQAVGMVVGVILLHKHATVKLRPIVVKEIDNNSVKRLFKPDGSIIKDIYDVGLPNIIMQSIGSVTTICLNAILITFSETAVTVLGLYFKIQSFIFMPVFGLNSGAMPIMAYNYGAKQGDRVKKSLFAGVLYALVLMLMGLLIFQTIPNVLLSLFNAHDELMTLGAKAFRIISLCFPFAGVCIMCSTLFQALGKGIFSLIVSICRQLLVIIPAAYLLATLTNDVNAVWFAYPIAELMSLTVTSLLTVITYKRHIKPICGKKPGNMLAS